MTDEIRKIQRLYDEADESYRDIYEAPGLEGVPITAEVPREEQQPGFVRRALLRKGAVLSSDDSTALAAAIATEAPVVRRAARTGWRDDNQLFVSHRYVAGAPGDTTVVPPACPLVGAAGQLEISGTLKGWQSLVSVARHSTTMIVALCAVFAAALLALVHRPSFALVLYGLSKIGKSFAQLVAASALGFGREEDLPSLNATPAGLLAAALGFNDHMLPINEIGTARGAKRDIYTVLRETTYALMNGQDTLRHPSWTGGGGGAASTFQVICMLSSEISPDAWAARKGETRDDGEMARLIGLPVLAPGCRTIFDRPPPNLTGDALAAWETGQFQRLRQGLPTHRGYAFPDFLYVLLGNVEAHTASARKLMATFEKHVGNPSMSPVARDIVAKFGVLYAGGVLAIKAKVLPLTKQAVGTAVRRACLAALAELPDPDAELWADLKLLKDKLSSGAIVDLQAYSPQKQQRVMRNADGFHQPKNQGREFVIRAQVFVAWFGTPLQNRRILEWLDEEGFLNHGRNRSKGRSNEWAQTQTTWPDGTRQRSIVLFFPAGLADLERDG